MEVTILGTAHPAPQTERAGTSLAVTVGGRTVLVDCGPWATYRLVETGLDFSAIEDVFFTHHHMDHNVSFFHFVLVSWYFGRTELDVYGPTGTRDLVDGLQLAYRTHVRDVSDWRDIPREGVTGIEVHKIGPEFAIERDGWAVRALPVDHSVETYAYRFDEEATDASVVFSGDTQQLDSLAKFARGADLLIHECNLTGADETPLSDDEVHSRYAKPPFPAYHDWVFESDTQRELSDRLHSSPTEAGEVATAAGVDTLALTHFNPKRNPSDVEAAAESAFDGTVVAAEDGMVFSPGE